MEFEVDNNKYEGEIAFTFDIGGGVAREVLILNKDRFVYNGEEINDAGEAHKLFIQMMKKMVINQDSEDEE